METYEPGGSAVFSVEWRAYAGGPLTAVAGVTITITPVAGGAAVLGPTSIGISTPVAGINAYTWAVSATNGTYLVTWTGTDTDGDTVTATELIEVATPQEWAVSLAEVKAHANITTTTHDAELILFIETAQEIIEGEVGATTPRTVIEYVAGGTGRLWLTGAPVISITSVTELGTTIGTGYYRVGDSGELIRRAADGSDLAYQNWANGDVVVTYVAGRDPVPSSIRWAILELTVHLWRSTQNQRGGRARGEADLATGAAYALPNRVRDAIERYRSLPAVA